MKPLKVKIKEIHMPGRVSTKAITNWDREHGTLCTGCNKVLTSIFASCECWSPKENNHEHA